MHCSGPIKIRASASLARTYDTDTHSPDLSRYLQTELRKLPVLKSNQWQSVASQQVVLTELNQQHWQLSLPGQNETAAQSLTLWLPVPVDISNPQSRFVIFKSSKCLLLWREFPNQSDKAEKASDGASSVGSKAGAAGQGQCFDLGDNRACQLSAQPLQLGLQFDLSGGLIDLDPQSLRLSPNQ